MSLPDYKVVESFKAGQERRNIIYKVKDINVEIEITHRGVSVNVSEGDEVIGIISAPHSK